MIEYEMNASSVRSPVILFPSLTARSSGGQWFLQYYSEGMSSMNARLFQGQSFFSRKQLFLAHLIFSLHLLEKWYMNNY